MLRLMLLRHAKSDWSVAGAPDHDRKLNARGRNAATGVGEYLAAEKLIPELILCSTATRTRETCDRVTAELPRAVQIDYERGLYEATPDRIIALIAQISGGASPLLVIGHNPGMQLAALALAKDGSAKNLARLGEKFPTAALAIIDFDAPAWSHVKSDGGRLERFVAPRDILRTD